MAQLKREIGFYGILLLTLNAILGTGTFFLPALGIQHAGADSIFSWIVIAMMAILNAAYFGELVSLMPKAGGIYEFMKRSYGEVPSFIIGWITWIMTNVTIAMLVIGAIYYVLPGASVFMHIALAISIILFFNTINYRGIKQSVNLLMGFGIVTMTTLSILIIGGVTQFSTANFQFAFNMPAIFLAMFFIAETFFGLETTTFLSEEIKEVRKSLPKALVIAISIIAVFAFSIAVVLIGNTDLNNLSQSKAPLNVLTGKLFGPQISSILSVFMVFTIIGAAAGWVVSSPRLIFAMARDKLLPASLKQVHKKYHTPHKAIIFQTITTIVITLISFGSFERLLSLLTPLVLITYSAVMLCFIKMRKKEKTKRIFYAPFGSIGPYILILFNLSLILIWLFKIESALPTFMIGVILLLLGFPAYVSVKMQTDRKFIERFWDRFCFWFDFYMGFIYRGQELKRVIGNAKLRRGQVVLDYGAGRGAITAEISRKIKNGKVVATDLSKKQLSKAIKRLKRLNLSNIIYVKTSKPAPFEPRTFDRIICTIAVNYFVYPELELKALYRTLKKGGKVSFLAVKAPTIIMHDFLKKDGQIKTVFRNAGFRNVRVERVKKYWKELIYITGRK